MTDWLRLSYLHDVKHPLALFVLTLLAVLAPCRAAERVVFWFGASHDEKIAVDRMIAEFNRANPDIRVVGMLTPMQQIQQKLLLSVAGGVPPDVVRFYTELGGEMMAREGLERMDLLAKRDGVDLSAFYPVAITQNTFHGKLYGMPWVVCPNALVYNRRLFREAGLDPNRPPRTWDELKQYALKLTKRDPKSGAITQLGWSDVSSFQGYLWQSGGELLTPDGRHPAFNTEETVRMLEFWVQFQDDEAGNRQALNAFVTQFSGAATDPFGMEKLAMRLDTPFRIPDLKRYFPHLDYGVAPLPTVKYHVSEVVGNSLVIPRGSHHKEAAWRFIRFATSRQQLLNVCAMSGRLPARISAARDPRYTSDPLLGPFVKALDNGRTLPLVPGYMEMLEAIGRQTDLILNHHKTAREAMNAAAVDSERILSRSNEDVSRFPVVRWGRVVAALGAILAVALIAIGASFARATRHSRRERREALEFLAFLSPWLCGFLLLTFGAVAGSMALSFSKWDVLTPGRWVGWRNYTDLFTNDPRFLHSLANTGIFTLMAVPVSIVSGLAVAMLLNLKLAGIRVFRTLFYLPVVVSGVATALLWKELFNPNTGIINKLLTLPVLPALKGGLHFVPLIVNPPGWLADPVWSKPALVIMGVWGVGGGMLIYLAGLQGIPAQLYEAAELDGARGWKRFRNVTLPLLTPVIFYQLVMGIIGSFQVFTQAYVMTAGTGQPEDSLLFYVLYLFNNAFQWLKIGYASAMAWVLFVIVLLVTLINFIMAKRWVYYEGGPK
ncbi:MAG TPA: extracellular solute-binding protein [Armatimonadota bacterium]